VQCRLRYRGRPFRLPLQALSAVQLPATACHWRVLPAVVLPAWGCFLPASFYLQCFCHHWARLHCISACTIHWEEGTGTTCLPAWRNFLQEGPGRPTRRLDHLPTAVTSIGCHRCFCSHRLPLQVICYHLPCVYLQISWEDYLHSHRLPDYVYLHRSPATTVLEWAAFLRVQHHHLAPGLLPPACRAAASCL